ncbi:phage holin [Staphylococcus haemolyticus]|nr:phage holin [Staphylococcus haemolyticus]PTK52150.1 phage holin [Staphylococcus haemolyticus]
MNWKLRFKNKAVLTGLVGAVLLFIKQVTELFGLDLSTQLEQISGLVGAILTLLAGLGVIVDPTSKGVKDSGITKTYSKPRDENIDPVEYQRKGYEPEQWNDDFAEEVEIEEGLRDVEDDEVIVDNFDSDINNSGVMLDTNQQVEGVVENGENTSTDK